MEVWDDGDDGIGNRLELMADGGSQVEGVLDEDK